MDLRSRDAARKLRTLACSDSVDDGKWCLAVIVVPGKVAIGDRIQTVVHAA
ncbi:hypothetical protein J2T55_001099 [Methylohalomonas lacus]|uniref:Uncharacterized protein n=1 Tax=Methylohalomonas lacus TaxID=398773 RepID=A0AAE3HLB8_9GAMM|nr:hypothetical protein [Methylohalomonas lacus]